MPTLMEVPVSPCSTTMCMESHIDLLAESPPSKGVAQFTQKTTKDSTPTFRDFETTTLERPAPSDMSFQMGPNEELYKTQFDAYVTSAIDRYNRKHPGEQQIRDFKSMTDVEKQSELQNVGNLLSRLGIDNGDDERLVYDGSIKMGTQQHSTGTAGTGVDDMSHGSVTATPNNNTTMCSSVTRTNDRSLLCDEMNQATNHNDKSIGSSVTAVNDETDKTNQTQGVQRVLFHTQHDNAGGHQCFDYDPQISSAPLAQCGSLAKKSQFTSDYYDGSTRVMSPRIVRNQNNDTTIETQCSRNSKSTALLSFQHEEDDCRIGDSRDESISPVELVRRHDGENGGVAITSRVLLSSTFQSPLGFGTSVNKKRLATTSGKKGADLQRSRTHHPGTSEECEFAHFNDEEENDTSGIIDSPSPLLCSSIQSLPSEPEPSGMPSFLAKASQSPIMRRNEFDESIPSSAERSSSSQETSPRQTIQFSEAPNHDSGGRYAVNDTIDSANCTLKPRRARSRADLGGGRGFQYYDDEAPANIHLRDGALFRMDPLRVRRPRKGSKHEKLRPQNMTGKQQNHRITSTYMNGNSNSSYKRNMLSIPDPLSAFPNRMSEHLGMVSDWLVAKDKAGAFDCSSDDENAYNTENEGGNEETTEGRGVILSMSPSQIIGVTLKLLLTNGIGQPGRASTCLGSSTPSETVVGGTLVVVRDKEAVVSWECALRERTCYSVLNHSAMSSTDRKRPKTAVRCAGFDIVLTTFDAIKSKEVTVPVDDRGRAMMGKSSFENGWYSSRCVAGSMVPQPQACEQLSILHQMKWFRIIFVDMLGRKSYVAKSGTARAKATIALNASSRFLFFSSTNESTGVLEEKLKDDRKQLRSIASALHMSEERAGNEIVEEAMLDWVEVKRTQDDKGNVEATSVGQSESPSMYEDEKGQIEDLSDSDILLSPT